MAASDNRNPTVPPFLGDQGFMYLLYTVISTTELPNQAREALLSEKFVKKQKYELYVE
jgi:hypothetical protein